MKLVMAFIVLFFAAFVQAANITPVVTNLKPATSQASMVVWSAAATGDVGLPVNFPTFTNKSVQITGTFGGATVNLEGSQDATTWFTVTDTANAAIACTAACLKQVNQNPKFLRMSVVGGAASVIVVQLLNVY